MSYWLPPEYIDPQKLKPRRLDPDEYDAMHTALTSLHKLAEKIGPQKLQELVGAVNLTPGEDIPLEKKVPPIYRAQKGGDRWVCNDCKDRGDKWYMQDHHCSRSKVQNLSWLRIKQGQRKAERIRKLQRENYRIV